MTQTPHTPSTPHDVVTAYAAAIDALDADALVALYADDLRLLDSFFWQVDGRDAWADHVRQWFGTMTASKGTRTENVMVTEGSDVAGLSMDVLFTGVSTEGKDESLWNRLTWVLRREGDGWLIAQEHTSVPLKMEDGTPDFRPTD
ncbi:YybH family protein [Mariniluteicoccus flavus]